MNNRILGLHHITAIAGDPQRNFDFYTRSLGLRLIKKTVNFDDPRTYHFYFGDEMGTPGTILTFFPWPGARPGKTGSGMISDMGFSVPQGSLGYWIERFEALGVPHGVVRESFGEQQVTFSDPDGLQMILIETRHQDRRTGWTGSSIPATAALKGFHTVKLSLNETGGTAEILEDLFGYSQLEREGNMRRFTTDAVENSAHIDVLEEKDAPRGLNSAGTYHHVAFRVKNEDILMEFREKVLQRGLSITDKIDRDYFFSLYFREPGGVLFEIATDNPGFTKDERPEDLGKALQLPSRYEPSRSQIEKALPEIR